MVRFERAIDFTDYRISLALADYSNTTRLIGPFPWLLLGLLGFLASSWLVVGVLVKDIRSSSQSAVNCRVSDWFGG